LSIAAKLKKEVLEVGATTLFFGICFSLLLLRPSRIPPVRAALRR
jgi:hypothetical protein